MSPRASRRTGHEPLGASGSHRLRYKEGIIDFLQLLDAKRTQLQAEDQVAQSESDVYIAVVSIYKAIGGGPS